MPKIKQNWIAFVKKLQSNLNSEFKLSLVMCFCSQPFFFYSISAKNALIASFFYKNNYKKEVFCSYYEKKSYKEMQC